jgi:hypothetical protein
MSLFPLRLRSVCAREKGLVAQSSLSASLLSSYLLAPLTGRPVTVSCHHYYTTLSVLLNSTRCLDIVSRQRSFTLPPSSSPDKTVLAAAFPFWLPPSWRALASFSLSASLLRARRSGSLEATRSHHNCPLASSPPPPPPTPITTSFSFPFRLLLLLLLLLLV